MMLCKSCLVEKPLEEFQKDTGKRLGYRPLCKDCRNQRHRGPHSREMIRFRPYAIEDQWFMLCRVCEKPLPLEAFPPVKEVSYGRGQPCRVCRNARNYCRIPPDDSIQHSMLCATCQTTKPLAQFWLSNNTKNGHTQPCKDCRNAALSDRRRKDPAPFRAKAKARKAKDPAKHRAIVRIHASRRRARQHLLPETFTYAERTFMLQYWGFACAVCGNEQGLFDHMLHDDHWIPLCSPLCPGTIAENIIPLCGGVLGCNNNKSGKDPHTWLCSRYGRRKGLRIEKAIMTYFAVIRQRTQSTVS